MGKRMRVTVSCLAVGLAVLAACSKTPAGGSSGPASATPQAAAPAPALFAPPHPKAGLWRMAMNNDAGPGIHFTGEICIDASTEDSAFQAGPKARPKSCEKTSIGPAPGGGVAFDTTCKTDGRTITSHGIASGDFSSAYNMDVTTTMTPAPSGMPPEMHMHMQATWLGPCKPDQTPGRMSMKMAGLGGN